MLALLSEAETKRIIKDNSKYYKNWRLTTAEVDKRVNQAKNNGIGTSLENFTESISGVGIAISSINSTPVLGVSVASVTPRVNKRRDFIIKKLQLAQAEISQFLKAAET